MTSGGASVRGGWSERHKWSDWNECTKRVYGANVRRAQYNPV